jgi:hypothetical protein
MTRIQRRNLQLYLHFRGTKMTIPRLIRYNARMYMLTILIFAIAGGFFYAVAGGLGASFAGVALIVLFLRDIGWYRRSIAIWPLLQQILDWRKVEELVHVDAYRA